MEFVMYTDGSIQPKNPGGHAVGAWVIKSVVVDSEWKTINNYMKGVVDLGEAPHMTNNIAEYEAVRDGLEKLLNRQVVAEDPPSKVIVKSDSKLVVNQLNRKWSCKVEHLRKIRDAVWDLCSKFECDVVFEWIPRDYNQEADALSRSLY